MLTELPRREDIPAPGDPSAESAAAGPLHGTERPHYCRRVRVGTVADDPDDYPCSPWRAGVGIAVWEEGTALARGGVLSLIHI